MLLGYTNMYLIPEEDLFELFKDSIVLEQLKAAGLESLPVYSAVDMEEATDISIDYMRDYKEVVECGGFETDISGAECSD